MTFTDDFIGSRRLFILRLLSERDGEIIESLIFKGALRGFHSGTSRDDIRADLDHLKSQRLTEETWHEGVCLVRLTDRGDDAAYGRVQVAGVEHSRWRK